MRFSVLLPVFCVAASFCGCDDGASRLRIDPLRPAKSGRMDRKLIHECSGFAASKKYPGVFWTLSDSGDTARIFAIDASGKTVANDAGKSFAGIPVAGATNTDWESLTIDGRGRLIIGDFGDNLSARKDLCLYVLDTEPDPRRAAPTPRARRVPFVYADRPAGPDPMKNHDGEAMFSWRDDVYILTKEWGATGSVLHRVDMTADEKTPKPTTRVCRFESHGMVTDAAVSPDGKRLAILTYTGVRVFDLPKDPAEKNPLSGRALYRPVVFPLTSWQVEAIAFLDDETLLVGNEEADLYRIKIAELAPAD